MSWGGGMQAPRSPRGSSSSTTGDVSPPASPLAEGHDAGSGGVAVGGLRASLSASESAFRDDVLQAQPQLPLSPGHCP